jgi:hypothetical protein
LGSGRNLLPDEHFDKSETLPSKEGMGVEEVVDADQVPYGSFLGLRELAVQRKKGDVERDFES